MKKTSILALVLAFTAVLPACGNTSATETGVADTTVSLVDKYTATESNEDIVLPEGFVIPEGYTYEKEYRYFSNGDSCDGIVYAPSTIEIYGDRLYYTSPNGLSYIDAQTGVSFALCPDPLCAHTAESGCQFLGLSNPIHHPQNKDILFVTQGYIVGTQIHINICVIDEKNGTVTKVYGTDVKGGELGGSIGLLFITGGKLYFVRKFETSETDETGKVINKVNRCQFTMDINTYKVEPLDNKYSTVSGMLLAGKDHIFFCSNGQIKVTDLNFGNERIIAEYDNTVFGIDSYYYDSVTDEMYISFLTPLLGGVSFEGPEEGFIYRIDGDLNCERLSFCDKIVNFTITRNYIYFTRYEPIELGLNRLGNRCAIPTGGKFYRVKRDGTGAVELVFDGGLEINHILHEPWFILGDYMYYSWAYVFKEADIVGLKVAGSKVRIGITDKTVKPILLN